MSLVNMTRPDLAFTYSQLSKFVQSPGPVHLAAAERALAYLRGTYNEGITYCDPGEERRNKLTGWVDSDFAADPDTRKSMTGYLFSLNGGAVSWRSSRQGGVTLSSDEAEFVAASQAGPMRSRSSVGACKRPLRRSRAKKNHATVWAVLGSAFPSAFCDHTQRLQHLAAALKSVMNCTEMPSCGAPALAASAPASAPAPAPALAAL